MHGQHRLLNYKKSIITNFLAQYPKGKVQQEMVDSGKRNDLSVNRT